MKKFMWVITIISSLIGGLIVLAGVAFSNGAPQEAAAAALGVAFAVVPYCIARAISEIGSNPNSLKS